MNIQQALNKVLPFGYFTQRISPAAELVVEESQLPPDQILIHKIGSSAPVAVIYHYNWGKVWVEKLSEVPDDLREAILAVGLTLHEGAPTEYVDYLKRVGIRK